jgi:hypothetical protein
MIGLFYQSLFCSLICLSGFVQIPCYFHEYKPCHYDLALNVGMHQLYTFALAHSTRPQQIFCAITAVSPMGTIMNEKCDFQKSNPDRNSRENKHESKYIMQCQTTHMF